MKNIKIVLFIIGIGFYFNYCGSDKKSDEYKQEKEALKTQIEKIRDKFLKTVEGLGFKVPYIPSVEISNTPQYMSFDGDDTQGIIICSFYEMLSSDQKSFFDKLAKNGDFTGEDFFKENFYWFLVIHELGHYIQEVKKSTLSSYQRELQANKIAVSYWKHTGEQTKLLKFIAKTQHVLTNMTKPSVLSESYVNNNYEDISINPEIYGYLQFTLYKKSLDSNPDLADFL